MPIGYKIYQLFVNGFICNEKDILLSIKIPKSLVNLSFYIAMVSKLFFNIINRGTLWSLWTVVCLQK